jgi:TatD DNase family protein
MPWADSHCHLTYEGLGAEAVLAARDAGVGRLITVGTDAASSLAGVELARDYEGVWATVGLHPHDATRVADGELEALVGLLDAPRVAPHVVAVGETGLDYHYDHSPRSVQQEVFAAQVALAHERGLTLVIHTREAWDDTFAIIEAAGGAERSVFHCFSGGPHEARRALDLGAYLSFSGIVTFKSAGEVRAAASLCPPDRMLIETDSPYLAPVPLRGKPNQPAFVPLVGAGVAAARGDPIEAVEMTTWSNAAAVFCLQ